MKQYTFEVTVNEQSDEWWEEITADGKSGCDEVLEFVKQELIGAHMDVDIRLTDYADKPDFNY